MTYIYRYIYFHWICSTYISNFRAWPHSGTSTPSNCRTKITSNTWSDLTCHRADLASGVYSKGELTQEFRWIDVDDSFNPFVLEVILTYKSWRDSWLVVVSTGSASWLVCRLCRLKCFGDVWAPGKDNAYFTSSTARGGGGSFTKRKTIGEIGCCESRMSKPKHWPTD